MNVLWDNVTPEDFGNMWVGLLAATSSDQTYMRNAPFTSSLFVT